MRFINQLKKAWYKKKFKKWSSSKTFCMAPFVHLHALPSGHVYACCQSAHEKANAVGNLQKQSIKEVWNGDRLKEIRSQMVEGKPISLCERCYSEERRGQESLRMSMNGTYPHHAKRVLQSRKNNFEVSENIPYLDIRFSNVCNFKCRICGPDYSTTWFSDVEKLNPGYAQMYPKELVVSKDIDSLWKQLEPHMNELESIHFAGGEPLLMEEHYLILKRLVELKRFDVKLSYNTNFSTRRYKRDDIFKMWKHFPSVLVLASLDGMGKRGEYLRKGQNWEKTERLRRELLEECPHIQFRLDPTVSMQNAWHMPDFYTDWLEKGLLEPNQIRLNLLNEPSYYHVKNIPQSLKRKIDAKYQAFLTDLEANSKVSAATKNEFKAVLTHMWQEGEMESAFYSITQQLDAIRNEKFFEVFPELEEDLQLVSS